MIKTKKKILILYFMINSFNFSLSEENFFNKGLDLFKAEKFKDAKSYLYLAKIYNHEENQRKEEYNLDTALLIEPNNEEDRKSVV